MPASLRTAATALLLTLALLPAAALAQDGQPAPATPEAPAAATPAEPTVDDMRAASGLQAGSNTGRALPRFESFPDVVNVRQGPGVNHKVLWTYRRKDLPVKVIQESDQWRKVRDWTGEEGWVLGSLLRRNRHVLVTAGSDLNAENIVRQKLDLRLDAADNAIVVARVEEGAVADLLECVPDWCRIQFAGYAGWMERESLYGVDPQETGLFEE